MDFKAEKIAELEARIRGLEEEMIDIDLEGRKVVHKKFGEGTILSIDEETDRVKIDWVKSGFGSLMLSEKEAAQAVTITLISLILWLV